MFSKKESYKLDKLNLGFTFKLKNTIWTILEVGEYDWSGDGRSIEYKIESKNGTIAYLEVEFIKNDYEVYFSEAVFIENPLLQDAVISKSILYLDEEFYLEEHYTGNYKNTTTQSSWERLDSFMFYNDNETLLTIEKWADGSYETFIGEEVSAKKIKNITPN